nr:DUF1800 domain-containing protein [Roseococcus suduntuyensis]
MNRAFRKHGLEPRSRHVVTEARFGLGLSPREALSAHSAQRSTPQDWTRRMADPLPPGTPNAVEGLDHFLRRRTSVIAARARGGRPGEGRDWLTPGEVAEQVLKARLDAASTTQSGFAERLVWFWNDHFTASAAIVFVAYFLPDREQVVIRPGLRGSFASLLKGAVLHPSMIFYLDQRRSLGPNSELGARARGRLGLNENLAREILELHTLGADGGYTQEDVSEFAMALTGWSMDIGPQSRTGQRLGFFPERQEPGPRRVLGRVYTQTGPDLALAILDDLAHHPATARNVTRRMVRHFVGHGLPGLEARLETTFLRTQGDLGAVTRALVEDVEAWGPPRKVRSPMEFLFATARLLGGLPAAVNPTGALRAMGQPFWSPSSPKGWPLEDEAWAAPDAIKTRLDWAKEVAAQVPPTLDPVALLDATYGSAASPETRRAVARAADRRQGLALLLLSPEFQRR